MEANGTSEKAESYVRRYFGGGKGTATGMRKVWQGQGEVGVI